MKSAGTLVVVICDDLRDADPGTLRYRVSRLPARLVRHARRRILKFSPDWP